jgi:transglutaminase-like putative cysteine protease
MNDREPLALRGAERLSWLATVTGTVLAIATLPPGQVPIEWLVAFTAPAVSLGLLRRRTEHPWRRAALATVLQVAACWLAFDAVGPLSRPAALACTILPPLSFVTARHRDADSALALFLAFCMLLVGSILGGVRLPLVAAYAAAACVALRVDASLAVRRETRPPARAADRGALGLALSAAAMVLPCLFAAVAIERTIGYLPSPSRDRTDASDAADASARSRRVGLSDSFVLGGGDLLTNLTGEQLVRVVGENGAPVPTDLYLRSGFFAEPGLDRWQLGALETSLRPGDTHTLRRPRADVPMVRFDLERYHGARNFVFVPPGVVTVQGVGDLVVDGAREWLRQREGAPMTPYVVAWQDLPPPALDEAIDPRWRRHGLARLPTNLDRARFLALLTEWQVSGPPLQAAARIAEGLARRCRYDRIEPVGPYAHAIENFLFATGDRRGYCMHFASAAALLLRLCDVPCRIGVGLHGGDADPTEPGARIFGSQHAHAWVEIPIGNRGYVVFDPTPPAERGQRMPSLADPTAPDDEARAARERDTGGGFADLLVFVTQPWLLAVVLLLAIASTRWPARDRGTALAALPPLARNARRLLQRLLRALGDGGHVRRHGETLEQFAARLATEPATAPAIAAAFAAYQEVRFGGRPFDDEREGRLQAGVEAALRCSPATASPSDADHGRQPQP